MVNDPLYVHQSCRNHGMLEFIIPACSDNAYNFGQISNLSANIHKPSANMTKYLSANIASRRNSRLQNSRVSVILLSTDHVGQP